MKPLSESYLRWPDILALTGVSENTVRSMIKRGEFPPNQRVPGGKGWTHAAIAAWLAEAKKEAGLC